MTNDEMKNFEALLRSDEGVQAKLRAAVDAYDGDKADDQALFEATIGKVAEELGLSLSYEEAKAYAGKMTALDDVELDAVAGGGSCYFIGGSKKPEAGHCDPETGSGACAYIGITYEGIC